MEPKSQKGKWPPTDTLAAVDVLEESFVAVEFGRALLARMTPSFADRGAAELFSADHSLQLALAHVIADASETWARTIICRSHR